MNSNKKIILKKLSRWWEVNKRNYLWRNTVSPYKIFIAEIMLQQTNAEKVKHVYPKFIENYPQIYNILDVKISEIEKYFENLGLLKRANYIKTSADIIIQKYNGEFPSKKDKLLELPGVGNYVADAILCFAFNIPLGLMDTNTIRVISRIFNLNSEKARKLNDKKLYKKINNFVIKGNSKEINYALLDFAAIICKSKNPLCDKCVIRDYCRQYNDKQAKKINYKKSRRV